nr:sigma-70 family RNA polymerase sigma factor [Mycobacterium sp. URHB0044]
MARAHTECASATVDPASAVHFEREMIPLLEPLRRRAIQMTTALADAEDLLQETLLKAYAGRDSFQPHTNLKAWLFRIMTNTCISSYRTAKRRPVQYPTDHITDRQLAASAAHGSAGLWSAEDEALATLPDSEIKAAMQSLPEQFRVAVYFADVVGLSYKEIAAIMETEQGTVSSRINRGREQLRNLLVDSPSRRPGGGPRHRTVRQNHSPG